MAQNDGLTLLGPLTTIFTPPASCDVLTVLSISSVYTSTVYVTDSDGSTVSSSRTRTTSTTTYLEKYDYSLDGGCYPTGYTTSSAYYSPGRCPSAWNGVVTTVQNNETTIQCCPASFTFSGNGQLCRSTVTGYPTTPVIVYINTQRVDSTPTASWIFNDIVWASGVAVRFKDGDFPNTTPGPTTTPGPITTPAGPTQPSVTDPNSNPGSDSNSGLSLGAKVGIGVGVPAAALILAGLIFFLFWRHRNAKKPVPIGPVFAPLPYNNTPPPPQQYQSMAQPYPGTGYYMPHYAEAVEAARASEIYTPGMGTESAPFEAPAGQSGQAGTGPRGYAPVPVSQEQVMLKPPSATTSMQRLSGASDVSQSRGSWVERPGGAGPLPTAAELYPEYGAFGDEGDEAVGTATAPRR